MSVAGCDVRHVCLIFTQNHLFFVVLAGLHVACDLTDVNGAF